MSWQVTFQVVVPGNHRVQKIDSARTLKDRKLVDATNRVPPRVEPVAPVGPDVPKSGDLSDDPTRREGIAEHVVVFKEDLDTKPFRLLDKVPQPVISTQRAFGRISPGPTPSIAIIGPPDQVNVKVLDTLVDELPDDGERLVKGGHRHEVLTERGSPGDPHEQVQQRPGGLRRQRLETLHKHEVVAKCPAHASIVRVVPGQKDIPDLPITGKTIFLNLVHKHTAPARNACLTPEDELGGPSISIHDVASKVGIDICLELTLGDDSGIGAVFLLQTPYRHRWPRNGIPTPATRATNREQVCSRIGAEDLRGVALPVLRILRLEFDDCPRTIGDHDIALLASTGGAKQRQYLKGHHLEARRACDKLAIPVFLNALVRNRHFEEWDGAPIRGLFLTDDVFNREAHLELVNVVRGAEPTGDVDRGNFRLLGIPREEIGHLSLGVGCTQQEERVFL